jgi:hypothetical protein
VAEREVVEKLLSADPGNVVVKALDEFSHVAAIYVWSIDSGVLGQVSEPVLAQLIASGRLLSAPHRP